MAKKTPQRIEVTWHESGYFGRINVAKKKKPKAKPKNRIEVTMANIGVYWPTLYCGPLTFTPLVSFARRSHATLAALRLAEATGLPVWET